jgi:hypothetical protein
MKLSGFNCSHPTKFIIHGYNSGMDLDVLVDIRKGEQAKMFRRHPWDSDGMFGRYHQL